MSAKDEPTAMLKIRRVLDRLEPDSQERIAVWVRRTYGPQDKTGAERAHRYRDRHAVTTPESNGVTSRESNGVIPPLSSRSKSPLKPPCIYTPGFIAFWETYPKRVGKGEAFRAWTKGNGEVVSEVVVKAVREQIAYLNREGGKFTPLPATWLNQRRWEDEPPTQGELSPKTAANMAAGKRFLERGSTP